MGQLFSFIILLTSIFTFFFFGEIRNLTTFTRLMDYNNGFSISSFFLSLLSSLWIGAQFPQEKFLSYGRILTLDFYFLLMNGIWKWKKKARDPGYVSKDPSISFGTLHNRTEDITLEWRFHWFSMSIRTEKNNCNTNEKIKKEARERTGAQGLTVWPLASS